MQLLPKKNKLFFSPLLRRNNFISTFASQNQGFVAQLDRASDYESEG